MCRNFDELFSFKQNIMEHTGGYRNERIEEWMEQQEVSSCESFCGCCDPQSIKRRRARYVLFKQLVLEEIEKRCQKYEDKLLPEEKKAIEEVKEKFSRGNYRKIYVSYNFVGMFYTPLTIILSLLYPRVLFLILFPVSYITYWMIGILQVKDKCYASYINATFFFFLLIMLSYILFDIPNALLFIPFVLLIFLLVVLTMLAVSIVFCYGFKYLSSYGVLYYRFQISLLEEYSGVPMSYTIRHAPFQRLYSRPILNIFQDMDISSYNFGEINGQLVTQDGINSYNQYYHSVLCY